MVAYSPNLLKNNRIYPTHPPLRQPSNHFRQPSNPSRQPFNPSRQPIFAFRQPSNRFRQPFYPSRHSPNPSRQPNFRSRQPSYRSRLPVFRSHHPIFRSRQPNHKKNQEVYKTIKTNSSKQKKSFEQSKDFFVPNSLSKILSHQCKCTSCLGYFSVAVGNVGYEEISTITHFHAVCIMPVPAAINGMPFKYF